MVNDNIVDFSNFEKRICNYEKVITPTILFQAFYTCMTYKENSELIYDKIGVNGDTIPYYVFLEISNLIERVCSSFNVEKRTKEDIQKSIISNELLGKFIKFNDLGICINNMDVNFPIEQIFDANKPFKVEYKKFCTIKEIIDRYLTGKIYSNSKLVGFDNEKRKKFNINN